MCQAEVGIIGSTWDEHAVATMKHRRGKSILPCTDDADLVAI